MNETSTTSWERPSLVIDPSNRPGRGERDIETRLRLIDEVIAVAEAHGWSKAEVSRRIGMPEGSFSQWYSGKYEGRFDGQNEKVDNWLRSVQEARDLTGRIPLSPDFTMTRTARDVFETLAYAQMMPEMVTITLGAGMGKTTTCRHYCSTRPHAHLVTMRPHTKTVHGMLVDLAAALDVVQHNPAKIDRAIGRRLENRGGNSLLVVDEAQNLKDEAIDQLRHFLDIYQCGIALVGNMEIYTRFAKRGDGPSYAQIRRRIGKRLLRAKPRTEDISMLLDAWAITDPEMRKLLTGIGMKDGALGQIDKTIKLAAILATGAGQELGMDHLRAAWTNRDVEGMA